MRPDVQRYGRKFRKLKTEINFDASKLQNKIEEIKIKGKRNISKVK